MACDRCRSIRTVVFGLPLPALLALAFIGLPGRAAGQGPPAAGGREDPVAQAIRDMDARAGGGLSARRSALTGLVSFLAAKPGRGIPVAGANAAERARAFVGLHGPAFGIADLDGVSVARIEAADEVGMDHVRFRQVQKGVPVTGGEVTVHLRGAEVVAVNARTLADLDSVDTAPAVEASAAALSARMLVEKSLGVYDAGTGEPRLEILNRGLLDGSRQPTFLAWFVEVTGPALREFVWVDARRGSVVFHFSHLTDARNRKIYTANNTSALPGTLLRTEGGLATGDADADKAYDYSGDTYNYFHGVHGRDSYDDAGAPLVSTVHYCPSSSSCPYQNAFWNGVQMVYGEGFSRADDVDAHELTHAVTEYSADLFYYMQSGALNESFSDIFGETVDLTNARGNDAASVRWLVGEDLPGIGAIRDMMDPTAFGDPGKLTDWQFACWDSVRQDSGGVHTNSGVPNHAYALMVDGGTYNGVTVTGIGLTKAGRIEYRALTVYLLSASDFLDDDSALKQSCSDLVGTSGITADNCAQVTKALDAVQMALPWPCPGSQAPVPELCPDGQVPRNLFFDDFESGLGSWTLRSTTSFVPWFLASAHGIHYATSGADSLWGYDYNYPSDSSAAMKSSVALPGSGTLRMQFNHSWGFENSGDTFYDGGVLEYSTNGGTTWSDAKGLISSSGAGYHPSGTIASGWSNPLAGRSGFLGESWGYTATQLDLSGLAGRSVRFRFRIGTDSCCDDYGWFVDDVRIYQCVDAPPPVTISINDVEIREGNAGTRSAVFTVSLSEPASQDVSVDYATADGTATDGSDYSGRSGTLTVSAGSTLGTVSVPVLGDTDVEDDETFVVDLSNAVGATILDSQGIGTIKDDDRFVSITDASRAEGDAGSADLVFTVSLTGPSGHTVTVDYATANGTAVAGSDYASRSGTLSFSPGETSKTIAVPILGDAVYETDESFRVSLSAPSNAALHGGPAIGTIQNDDPAPVLAIDDVTVAEGDFGTVGAVFTVTKTGATEVDATVAYATADGTARASADYRGISGTLTIPPAGATQTIVVPVVGDTLDESDETFTLNLRGPVHATLGDAQGIGTIVDDDTAGAIHFDSATIRAAESDRTATIKVVRTGGAASVTVRYATADGTASAGSDYRAAAGSLRFDAGVTALTLTVRLLNDAVSEGDETVNLTLSDPGGGAVLDAPSAAVLTILDDDQGGALTLSSATYSVGEASLARAITVTRRDGLASSVTVDYATSDGTATAGSDYLAQSGSLVFPAGAIRRTFSVPILDDALPEAGETLGVTLLNPTGGAVLGEPSAATLTILDDEPRVQFGSEAYSAGEARPVAIIRVLRSGSLAEAVSVDYATSDGTATAGEDYTATSGTLAFPAGATSATFAVPITGDALAEGKETVRLTLSNAVGASLGRASAVLTIDDGK